MTCFKRIAALFLAAVLLFSLGIPAQAAEESTDALVRKLINYYEHYQEDAQLDYQLILAEIEKRDPALAKTWSGILDFWIFMNRDMEVHSDVLPDGLPEDDSLCIAVMGYQLKPDGDLKDQLVSRLKVALASAEKYPNSYILCTGGGTASENEKATEAGQMAKWLKRKGIDPERIIVEDDAMSTIQNAQYGCKLLYRDYPQVKYLAVITSDYHIFRSCLYFNTEAALAAYENGVEPMQVVANATCRIAPLTESDLDTQVEGMCILTGLDASTKKAPKRAYLSGVQVSGQTEYELGEELNLTVSALYSTGFTKDVTSSAKYTGFDFGKSGTQTVTVSYAEGDNLQYTPVEILVKAPPTVATEPPSEAVPLPTETEPVYESQPQEEPASLNHLLLLAGICTAALIVLLVLKKRGQKKRRRPKPTIDLS